MDYRVNKRRQNRMGQGRLRRHKILNFLTLSRLTKYAFFGVVAIIILTVLLFVYYSFQLPQPGKIAETKYADATRIYDRKGELLYSVYADENRTYVGLSKISKDLQRATISVEDENFYKNKGFDPLGPLRIIKNLILTQRAIGASSITQQLVKNILLTNERNLPRKIKELILAIQVDSKFSKDQILEMYLNNIPYGGATIGIEAATQTYFGKSADKLDVAESAFLAGLPQSPSVYSPFTGDNYYIGRTKVVLSQMVKNKYISQTAADKAEKEITNYKFSKTDMSMKAPHFVLYVKKLLADQFGEQMVERGGLQVTTSLDYSLQKQAESILKEEISKLGTYKVGNGAALITDPKNGEILSMVGSKDYFGKPVPDGCTSGVDCVFEPNYNTVFARRQPGSSLKPIIYATGFESGYTAATLLMDVKTTFQASANEASYTPVNYDGTFHGPMQVRFALGNSMNIPAVKMLSMVGIKNAMQKAYEMGITDWQPTDEVLRNVGYSLVLGGRETSLFNEVTAYGVFANQGERKDLVSILKVADNKGKILYQHLDRNGSKVISPEIAFLISHILLDNNARSMEFGTSSYLNISGKTVAVKTGTTDEKRDNWTVGYTPSYVVGVWVGNNDNSKMNPTIASGVTGASSIWNKLMTYVLKGKPDEQFIKPDDVIAMQIDSMAGGLTYNNQPARSEYFIKGTEPTLVSPVYQQKDGQQYLVFREEDPLSTDGVNRWQIGIDAWIEQMHKDDKKYHPPGDIMDKHNKPTDTPAVPTSQIIDLEGGQATITPTPSPTPV
jgi:penicillin-binding protein 1C